MILLPLLFGLLFGSFFNVVGLRVPKGESINYPPSHCPHCRHRLGVWDLIPVAGWLIRKGKCAYCGEAISRLYPLGELLTAALFIWVYLKFGLTWAAAEGILLVSLSMIIGVSDLKYMLVPNKVLLFFAPLLIAVRWFHHPQPIWSYLAGFLVGGGILLVIALASKGGMGMGDVKLFALYGWSIGLPHVLIALFIASLLGSIVGYSLRALKLLKPGQHMPFAPYLALGSIIMYGYGDRLIHWYLTLIR